MVISSPYSCRLSSADAWVDIPSFFQHYIAIMKPNNHPVLTELIHELCRDILYNLFENVLCDALIFMQQSPGVVDNDRDW